jgi:hypothetical protein
MKEIRTLRADEIECRVQQVKKNGCVLLIYKDARVDMRILDEVYGSENWQRTHEVINGNLFCNVEIWCDTKKQWVKKQDVGTESNTEKQKGEASDSFKRACFNVGIGRELYTAPFIWINLAENEVTESNGKFSLKFGIIFSVKEIEYNENKEITKLVIIDNKKNVRFSYNLNALKKQTEEPADTQQQAKEYNEMLAKAIEEMKACKSYEEICAVWKKYQTFTKVDEFIKITVEMQKTYPNAKK